MSERGDDRGRLAPRKSGVAAAEGVTATASATGKKRAAVEVPAHEIKMYLYLNFSTMNII